MSDTNKLIIAAIVVILLVIGLFIGSKSGQIPRPNQTEFVKQPTPTLTASPSAEVTETPY